MQSYQISKNFHSVLYGSFSYLVAIGREPYIECQTTKTRMRNDSPLAQAIIAHIEKC